MIAALAVLGAVCVALLIVVLKDESTYHSGYREGYRRGREDQVRLERAKARAGLAYIGIRRDER